MGLRGPRPKPTVIRLLEGNPSCRPINKREPHPPGGAPRCPAWLDQVGRSEWRRIMPVLDRMGLLTVVDRTALAFYCDAYSQFLAARKTLKAEGMSYKTESGYIVQRPEVSIYHRLHQIVRNWTHEFGLTPSARGRMTAGEVEERDDLEALLS